MVDFFSGLNFGIATPQILLMLMAATHLYKGMRFSAKDERTVLWLFLFIMLFSAIDRGVLAVIATPSRIANAQDISVLVYIVPLVSRVLLAFTLWGTVLWIWFVFWPRQKGEKNA